MFQQSALVITVRNRCTWSIEGPPYPPILAKIPIRDLNVNQSLEIGGATLSIHSWGDFKTLISFCSATRIASGSMLPLPKILPGYLRAPRGLIDPESM